MVTALIRCRDQRHSDEETAMSREDAKSFLGLLERDPALLRAATEATRGHEADRLIAVGAQRGLSFTMMDLATAWRELHPIGRSGELGDAELEKVSGGLLSYSELFHMFRSALEKLADQGKQIVDKLGR
jgi:predicted ribosomally synthesized peptide with nif11-like leader